MEEYHAPMVEYGNGVSQGAGQFAGSHGGGGNGVVDVGAQVSDAIGNAAHTISSMPPAELVVAAVLIVVGLALLRRAL
jgi:hypothetical protein